MKPAGGHLGMNKIYERMKLFTTWPGMKQEMENYIKKCEIVRKTKLHNVKLKCPYKLPLHPKLIRKNAVWIL